MNHIDDWLINMVEEIDKEIISTINNAMIYSDLFWSNQEKIHYEQKKKEQIYFPKEGF